MDTGSWLLTAWTGTLISHGLQRNRDGVGVAEIDVGECQRSLGLERHIRREPVQYAGFKLFYKNDKPLMTPKEVLGRLVPKPYVIIYQ